MHRAYVVDNDPNVRRLFAKVLSNAGFSVSTFNDGRELFRRHPLSPPDLMLVDLTMPGLRGDEVIRLCREEWNWTDTRYCLVTGSLALAESLAAEPDLIFEKPVHIQEMIRRCLDRMPLEPPSGSAPEAFSPRDPARVR